MIQPLEPISIMKPGVVFETGMNMFVTKSYVSF